MPLNFHEVKTLFCQRFSLLQRLVAEKRHVAKASFQAEWFTFAKPLKQRHETETSLSGAELCFPDMAANDSLELGSVCA